jgi:tripartite-type tricarboxylate transporter receptor subunit TctC
VSALPPQPAKSKFPSKSITLVVPAVTGGPSDATARLIAPRMGQILGQEIRIENWPGDGGGKGARHVQKARADGHTILLGSIGTHVLRPGIMAKPPYHPITDFEPIGLVASIPLVIVAPASNTAADLRAFIAQLKAGGSNISYASGGAGTDSHLACSHLQTLIGASNTHVPHQGMAPALADLMNGRVGYMCLGLNAAAPRVRDGKLKAFAIATIDRSPRLPNVPATWEEGLPGFRLSPWSALFAPRRTPIPIIRTLNYALAQALEDTQLQRRMIDQFGEIPNRSHRTPEALAIFLGDEINRWNPIIRAAGVQIR